jgi:hypothetical protein
MRRIRTTRAEVEAIETFARMAAGDAAARLNPEQHDLLEGKGYVLDDGHLTATAMEILLRDDVKGRLYLVVAGLLPRIAPTVEVLGDTPRLPPFANDPPPARIAELPSPDAAAAGTSDRQLFSLRRPKRVDPHIVLTVSATELRELLLEQFGRWPEIGVIPPVFLDAYERRDVRQLMDAGHLEFDRGSYLLRDPSLTA